MKFDLCFNDILEHGDGIFLSNDGILIRVWDEQEIFTTCEGRIDGSELSDNDEGKFYNEIHLKKFHKIK